MLHSIIKDEELLLFILDVVSTYGFNFLCSTMTKEKKTLGFLGQDTTLKE